MKEVAEDKVSRTNVLINSTRVVGILMYFDTGMLTLNQNVKIPGYDAGEIDRSNRTFLVSLVFTGILATVLVSRLGVRKRKVMV